MTDLIIEKGIPVPPVGRFGPRAAKYPYDKMEVGDSFVMTPAPETEDTITTVKRRMRQSTAWANKRYAPAKFTAREVEGGVRVWRVQ